jgi:hypothetical protein
LPATVRFAVVFRSCFARGPAAFVTLRAIVPPVMVPFRLSGRHFAFDPWSPDLPGLVDVDVLVLGPCPGFGDASANDAARPAANTTSRGRRRFM